MRGWKILSADISKSFLRGVTYDEFANLTGYAQREVNFYLSATDIPLLRTIPGFEDSNPAKEVLPCDKPGAGLADAPRAFQIKLTIILLSQCKMTQINVAWRCYRHDGGVVASAMTIHVDVPNIAGGAQIVSSMAAELEMPFRQRTVQRGHITNCGTGQIQDPTSMDISLDSVEYAGALRTMGHPQMKTGMKEEKCTLELYQVSMSLLRAVANLSHMRFYLIVCIVALQRRNHHPGVQHVRNLNTLLRCLQRKPEHLTYNHMPDALKGGQHMIVISDAPSIRRATVDIVFAEHSSSNHREVNRRSLQHNEIPMHFLPSASADRRGTPQEARSPQSCCQQGTPLTTVRCYRRCYMDFPEDQ